MAAGSWIPDDLLDAEFAEVAEALAEGTPWKIKRVSVGRAGDRWYGRVLVGVGPPFVSWGFGPYGSRADAEDALVVFLEGIEAARRRAMATVVEGGARPIGEALDGFLEGFSIDNSLDH